MEPATLVRIQAGLPNDVQVSGLLHGRMIQGGRPKVYFDLDQLIQKKSVACFLREFREGQSRKSALYSLAWYLRWLKARGLAADPDLLVEECLNGINRTLVQNLNLLKEYCKGGAMDDGGLETRKNHYRTVRSFFDANLVSLPRSKLRMGGNSSNQEVRTEPTATEFLALARRVLTSGRLFVRDRSIILTMLQSGMDDSTLAMCFNYVGYPQLVKHFETEDWREWRELAERDWRESPF